MSKEELWAIFVKRNPRFLEDGANFTPTGLRKFFDQAFDQGYIEGRGVQEQSQPSEVDRLASMFGMR